MDFMTTSGVLTFNTSTPIQCGQVTIINDTILENDETFFVLLESTEAVVIIGSSLGNVTILDDDRECGKSN